jgi:hypothetical protein
MLGRKKIDSATIIYELRAADHRRNLGPPGNPKKQVPVLLARIKNSKSDVMPMLLHRLKEQFPLDFEQEQPMYELDNPEFAGALFFIAAQLDRNMPVDRSMAIAFEAAGLDVRNALHWRLLMETFCWAHFGDKSKPGKPLYWTSERYCALLRDIHELKAGGCKDAGAIRQLLKNRGKKYNHVSAGRLKKALAEARSIHFNSVLKKETYEAASAELARRNASGQPPLSEFESRKRLKQIARHIADKIGGAVISEVTPVSSDHLQQARTPDTPQ